MNLEILAMCAVFGVGIALVVDGRLSVAIAPLAAALGLAPAMANSSGDANAMALLVSGAASFSVFFAAQWLATRSRWQAGLSPGVPMFDPAHALFGPRSARVAVAALSLPVASWLSFSIPVGSVASTQGVLFPAAFACLSGVGRILVARTVEDVGIGSILVAAGVTAATVSRGPVASVDLAALLTISVLICASLGWLAGRHAQRPQGDHVSPPVVS